MTKYHMFAGDEYDSGWGLDSYIGVFDSLEAAYKYWTQKGQESASLAVVGKDGALEKYATDDERKERTNTHLTVSTGWRLEDGGFVAMDTTVTPYKASKTAIEQAAQAFAKEHGVEFLGIGEYEARGKLYITVRFDWPEKYGHTYGHPVERIPRDEPFQWEFDDYDRINHDAAELINRTSGEQLKLDRLSLDQFKEVASKWQFASGIWYG